jgi:predicted ATPase
MPLANLRLKNFKCFRDSGDIPLRPLTVIFGRNNTGKSSILQSLLLLRQTLESPEYGPRLDLGGPYYAAGSYADIVHLHQSSENIEISVSFASPVSHGETTFDLEISADEPNPPRLARFAVSSPEVEKLEIRRSKGRGGPYEMRLAGKRQGLEQAANFAFPLKKFFPLIGHEPPRRGRPNERHQHARAHARAVIQEVEQHLMSMRGVGAFRQQPERRYEYRGRTADTIDAMGQRVIDALIEDMNRRGKLRGQLFRSVNKWLSQVGRVRLRPLHRISKTRMYEVRLRDTDSGRWANFADVGFGIGQALPVFVEGLRTPEGGLFLAQEPEIHLHPDAQLGMADFLISLARSGRMVIAETHSENLLLRIRRSVLPGQNGRPQIDAKDVSLIYVAKEKSGTSTVRSLELDQMAQVENWPKGFMEEATEERVAILEESIAD